MEAAGTGPGKRTKSPPTPGAYLEHGMMRVRTPSIPEDRGRERPGLNKGPNSMTWLADNLSPWSPPLRCTRHRAFQTFHQTHSNAGLMQKQSAHGRRLKEHRLPLLTKCALGLLSAFYSSFMSYLLCHNFQRENFAKVSGQRVRFLPDIRCSEARRSWLNQGSKALPLGG